MPKGIWTCLSHATAIVQCLSWCFSFLLIHCPPLPAALPEFRFWLGSVSANGRAALVWERSCPKVTVVMAPMQSCYSHSEASHYCSFLSRPLHLYVKSFPNDHPKLDHLGISTAWRWRQGIARLLRQGLAHYFRKKNMGPCWKDVHSAWQENLMRIISLQVSPSTMEAYSWLTF